MRSFFKIVGIAFIVAVSIVLLTSNLNASVIFSDDFSGEPAITLYNYTGFSNWNVTNEEFDAFEDDFNEE